MTKAKLLNIVFQVIAAFWAVIVIFKAQVSVRWHAYAIAALGVVAISAVGTRLKHRVQRRSGAGSSEKMAAAPHH